MHMLSSVITTLCSPPQYFGFSLIFRQVYAGGSDHGSPKLNAKYIQDMRIAQPHRTDGLLLECRVVKEREVRRSTGHDYRLTGLEWLHRRIEYRVGG